MSKATGADEMKVQPRETTLVTADEKRKADRLGDAATSWFTHHGRQFPWRTTRDPYWILVAEVCLQKTNADKVAPVFKEIINKYPSIADLAAANPDELTKHFSQLGLMKRSRFLMRIAAVVLNQHDGVIPRDRDTLLKVTGIGDYTANSILCLAYGERLPLLDGSTQRVLGRLFNRPSDKPAWANKQMRDFMQVILPNSQAREFNLALIDIAYSWCRPRKPRCLPCPLRALCLSATSTGSWPNGS